jgi:hypothetical protein
LTRKEHRKLSELLTNIDYKRLEQIERTRNEYFQEMPTGHEFNKLNKTLLKEAYKKSKIGIGIIIALLILIGIITKMQFIIVALIAITFLVSYNYNKIADEYLQKDKSSPLTEEFFLEKLKEDGLEVIPDEIKRYNIFLDRYIHYKIRNRHHDVSSRAQIHFDKRDANEFTPEELLESAILFERESAFLKQEYTHHVV